MVVQGLIFNIIGSKKIEVLDTSEEGTKGYVKIADVFPERRVRFIDVLDTRKVIIITVFAETMMHDDDPTFFTALKILPLVNLEML